MPTDRPYHDGRSNRQSGQHGGSSAALIGPIGEYEAIRDRRWGVGEGLVFVSIRNLWGMRKESDFVSLACMFAHPVCPFSYNIMSTYPLSFPTHPIYPSFLYQTLAPFLCFLSLYPSYLQLLSLPLPFMLTHPFCPPRSTHFCPPTLHIDHSFLSPYPSH